MVNASDYELGYQGLGAFQKITAFEANAKNPDSIIYGNASFLNGEGAFDFSEFDRLRES